MNATARDTLSCPLCGQQHRPVALLRGERADCARCGTTLEMRSWWGRNASLSFAVAGLALALPAALEPFVTIGKLGGELTTRVVDTGLGLWQGNMMTLGAWVWTCGILAPFVLLLLLVVIRLSSSRGGPAQGHLARLAKGVAFWAMPEVQVLGVLVSFFKLGALVDASTGPGFWCYATGACCMLMAWRLHSLHPGGSTRNGKASA